MPALFRCMCCGSKDAGSEGEGEKTRPVRQAAKAKAKKKPEGATPLWEVAYERLDGGLRGRYEELLGGELGGGDGDKGTQPNGAPKNVNQTTSAISKDPQARKAQLDKVIQKGKLKLEKSKSRYEIAGHQFVLDEQIANAAEFVLWGKDLVDNAIKASSEAALVWAGVCLVLPLLTNPLKARQANEEGFVMITSRLDKYIAMERALFPESGGSVHRDEGLMEFLETSLVELYKAILEYQIESVLRFYYSFFKRLRKDIRNPAKWKAMADGIETMVKNIHDHLVEINEDAMVKSLDELEKNAVKMNETMERQLHVAEEQLKVLEETRDIEKMILNMEKYNIKPQKGAAYDDADVGRSPCQEDTRKSIREEITNWAIRADTDVSETVFWLHGGAGMGKSAIAQTIAHEFAGSRQLGATYFFRRPGRSKANRFASTITSALVSSIPQLEQYVYESIEEEYGPMGKIDLEGKNLTKQFDTLVFEPLQMLSQDSSIIRTRLLVIDGLDECEDYEQVRLICKSIVKLRRISRLRFRVLLTSRDERPIGLIMREAAAEGTVRIRSLWDTDNLEESKHDIRAYLSRSLSHIKSEREVSQYPWPSPEEFERLFAIATDPSPLFIYAATVCLSLLKDTSEPPQAQLARWLDKKYEGSPLVKMYELIVERLLPRDNEHHVRIFEERKTKLQRILGAIILLNQPLSVSSLASFLDLTADEVQNTVNNLHAVLYGESEHDKTVRILHSSFRDFLLAEAKSADFDIWVDEASTHGMLAKRCLEVMAYAFKENMYPRNDIGLLVTDANEEVLARRLSPEVRYACVNWVEHVEKSGVQLDENGYQFLQTHFLGWLEAMASMGQFTKAIQEVAILDSIHSKSSLPGLAAFIHDMERFTRFCRPIVEDEPLLLYSSALVFAPSQSLVRQQFLPQCPVSRRCRGETWTPLLQTLSGHANTVEAIAYSATTGMLASGCSNELIRIWDPATGEIVQKIGDSDSGCSALAFSPDGKLLASTSFNHRTISLWDLETGDHVSHDHEGYRIRQMDFERTGSFLAVLAVDDESTVEFYSVLPGPAPALGSPTKFEEVTDILGIALSPTKDLLVLRTAHEVILWDYTQQKCVWTHSFDDHEWYNYGRPISFSRDGTILAAAIDNTITSWRVSDGAVLPVISLAAMDDVCSLDFALHDANLLASALFDKPVHLWEVSSGTLLKTLQGNNDVEDAVFCTVGQNEQLALSVKHRIDICDIGVDMPADTGFTPSDLRPAHAVVASSDLAHVARASFGEVHILDGVTGVIKHVIKGQIRGRGGMYFSATNQLVFADGRDIAVLDPVQGTTACIDQGWGNAELMQISPDGTMLAVPGDGAHDGQVHVLDIARRAVIAELKAPPTSTRNVVAVSTSGTLVAIAGPESVMVYETATGTLRKVLPVHKAGYGLSSMKFSLDDKLLSLAFNPYVLLWDLDCDAPHRTMDLEAFDRWALELAFSSTGFLAIASEAHILLTHTSTFGADVQKIPLGQNEWSIKSMSFSEDGSTLKTNRGLVSVEDLSTLWFLKPPWICRGEEKVLKLMPGYDKPTAVDYRDGVFVVGDKAGRVTMLEHV